MYRIGEFSKFSKVSVKTLRYYDEIHLFEPAYVDAGTNYRFYTSSQLMNIHMIQSYRQIGLGIHEIRKILKGEQNNMILEQRKKALQRQAYETQEQLRKVEFLMQGDYDVKGKSYHPVIKEIPEYVIYTKEFKIQDYKDYFTLIPPLGAELLKLNPDIKCVVPEYCYIEYLDGEYKEENIRIQFGEAVDQMGIAPKGVVFKILPATTVVSILHRGSYADIGLAYAYATSWIDQNQYVVIGNPRECVIDGIWNKEKEEDWLTEVQIPIAKDF